jgi:hypothetical protein
VGGIGVAIEKSFLPGAEKIKKSRVSTGIFGQDQIIGR